MDISIKKVRSILKEPGTYYSLPGTTKYPHCGIIYYKWRSFEDCWDSKWRDYRRYYLHGYKEIRNDYQHWHRFSPSLRGILKTYYEYYLKAVGKDEKLNLIDIGLDMDGFDADGFDKDGYNRYGVDEDYFGSDGERRYGCRRHHS